MASKTVKVNLEGRTIREVRKLTDEEMEVEGWNPNHRHGPPMAVVLDDGTVLFPSRDPEGNGPGCLFGRKGGVGFYASDVKGQPTQIAGPQEGEDMT